MYKAVLVSMSLAFVAASPAAAQNVPSAPALKTFTESREVQDLIEKAKARRKDGQPTVVETLLQFAPYRANLEYRAAVGPAAVHEKNAEMFYVIDGTGTLITGGKLVGETRPNAENLSGTGIEAGAQQIVTKGDFFLVPPNTPHWFSAIDGSLVLMSIYLPVGK